MIADGRHAEADFARDRPCTIATRQTAENQLFALGQLGVWLGREGKKFVRLHVRLGREILDDGRSAFGTHTNQRRDEWIERCLRRGWPSGVRCWARTMSTTRSRMR